MKRFQKFIAASALTLTVAAAAPALAQMDDHQMGGMGGGGQMGQMGGMHMMQPAAEGFPGCPTEGKPGWLATLSDAQRAQMDRMHLVLKKSMNMIEARLKTREAELDNLVTQDNPDMKAVRSKIDEVMELKKEMMTKRYDHMAELRAILTPPQRVSFDMMVLGMGHMMGHK